MSMMNFRSFRHDDYSELRGMMYALYREDQVNEPITDKKISRTITELRTNPRKGKIVIFEKNNMIVGYSVLIFYWSNEYGGNMLHVDELYVKPEHRQRGAATGFFKHISRKFKHKIVGVQLEVTPSNTKAMKYYKKLGFRKARNVHLMRI